VLSGLGVLELQEDFARGVPPDVVVCRLGVSRRPFPVSVLSSSLATSSSNETARGRSWALSCRSTTVTRQPRWGEQYRGDLPDGPVAHDKDVGVEAALVIAGCCCHVEVVSACSPAISSVRSSGAMKDGGGGGPQL